MTLKELIEKYPEWENLQVVVYSPDGEYHYVSDDAYGLGSVYKAKDHRENIEMVVFSHN